MTQSVLKFTPRQSAKIRSHRKENSFWKQLSLIDMDTGREVLCSRWYGAGTVSYCCVWLNSLDARGAGKAQPAYLDGLFATELTPAGEQLVIPGCERNLAPAKTQLDLF